MAHYCSDNVGHPIVNRAVALSFPKLRARYGDEVTYADDPKAHIRTEFGFDVSQVAKHRYTSERYREFIGFEVPRPLLERAFFATYDLHLDDVLGNVDLAIGSFRRAVSQFLPEITQAALIARRSELVREVPNFNEQQFLFRLSRAEYEKQWGTEYRKPSLFVRFLAWILRWIPKIGPLKTLDFKIPDAQTEDLLFQSVNATVDQYQRFMHALRQQKETLPDLDCDTGHKSALGEYGLADKAYARLLDQLSRKHFEGASPELRANILEFYSHPSTSRTRKDHKAWRNTLRQLDALAALQAHDRDLKR